MKKVILGLAFLTMTSVSFSAFAQKNNEKCTTECTAKKECKKEGKKECGKKCDDAKCNKASQRGAFMFEGLNLSDVQKEKIKALQAAQRVSKQEAAQEAKATKETKIAIRKDRKELRAKYLQDLKEILSGDQYQQFLQNYYINTPQHNKAKGKKGPKNGMRKGPQVQKGPKGGKAERPGK